jgi:hypothetical protein
MPLSQSEALKEIKGLMLEIAWDKLQDDAKRGDVLPEGPLNIDFRILVRDPEEIGPNTAAFAVVVTEEESSFEELGAGDTIEAATQDLLSKLKEST